MAVDNAEVQAAKGVLWPDEKVEVTVTQRRIGPGGSITTPTTVLATDKRIIILNRASFGIRQDYEVIPYKQITSVRLEHGIVSSSVFIRVMGYDRDKGLLKNGREEGEIDGLRNRDAQDLTDYLSRRLQRDTSGQAGGNADSGHSGAYVFCTKCGAKNDASANFCGKCGTKLRES